MMPSALNTVDDYPSLLWIALPPVLLFSAYYIQKWYKTRKLRLYGIGKGAPGFQTNVKKIRVVPEIAARIRNGEAVSPEEIEAASSAAVERPAHESTLNQSSGAYGGLPRGVIEERDDRHLINDSNKSVSADTNANEWLPESITKPTKRKKVRR